MVQTLWFSRLGCPCVRTPKLSPLETSIIFFKVKLRLIFSLNLECNYFSPESDIQVQSVCLQKLNRLKNEVLNYVYLILDRDNGSR